MSQRFSLGHLSPEYQRQAVSQMAYPPVITLKIPKASPSLNVVTGQHWKHYYDLKRQWLDLIWVAKIEAGIRGMPMFERAKVSIQRYGAKMLDADNLTGGAKALVDSLKKLGFIVDDSPAHIELVVTQCTDKEKRTVIIVERLK